MSAESIRLSVVDMHTAGEPVRIVTRGYPQLRGATILEKRREALMKHDALRRALMLEPRGHAGMYGVLPVQPCRAGAQFAALFMHCEGYSTMCGHATIALGKWLVETGQAPREEPQTRFTIELPCGLVDVRCELRDGRVIRTAFDSVPAFLRQRDIRLHTPGLGEVVCDLAYGGAYYLLLKASSIGLDFFASPLSELVAAGAAITRAGRQALRISHPGEQDLGFLYGAILTDDAPPPEPSYNLCIFADGQIDRSPTGSGVTARMAHDYALGLIPAGVERRFYGPTGVGFDALVPSEHAQRADSVRVRVAGAAAYSGEATFEIHPDDPLGYGFELPSHYGALRTKIESERR